MRFVWQNTDCDSAIPARKKMKKVKTTKLTNGLEMDQDAMGNKYYYLNNRLHREDGPAIEYINGNKFWFINGNYHRENGPAIEYADSELKSWWVNGIEIPCRTQKEFERLMRLKAFW